MFLLMVSSSQPYEANLASNDLPQTTGLEVSGTPTSKVVAIPLGGEDNSASIFSALDVEVTEGSIPSPSAKKTGSSLEQPSHGLKKVVEMTNFDAVQTEVVCASTPPHGPMKTLKMKDIAADQVGAVDPFIPPHGSKKGIKMKDIDTNQVQDIGASISPHGPKNSTTKVLQMKDIKKEPIK